MVEQIFLSPQVKRSVTISINWYIQAASQVAEQLGFEEISGKSQNLIELLPSAQSLYRNKIFSILVKIS